MRVWKSLLNCRRCSIVLIKLIIDVWPVCWPVAFMAFARSSYRRSIHFAITSLFLLSTVAGSSNLDLLIITSALRSSHQLFTCSCNRWRWRLYRSFLDPNNMLSRFDQHSLLQFSIILEILESMSCPLMCYWMRIWSKLFFEKHFPAQVAPGRRAHL